MKLENVSKVGMIMLTNKHRTQAQIAFKEKDMKRREMHLEAIKVINSEINRREKDGWCRVLK